MNLVMTLRVPQNAENFLSSQGIISLSARTLQVRVSQLASQSVSQSVSQSASQVVIYLVKSYLQLHPYT
jgi:chromosomal replication initiation ATPase DnaA